MIIPGVQKLLPLQVDNAFQKIYRAVGSNDSYLVMQIFQTEDKNLGDLIKKRSKEAQVEYYSDNKDYFIIMYAESKYWRPLQDKMSPDMALQILSKIHQFYDNMLMPNLLDFSNDTIYTFGDTNQNIYVLDFGINVTHFKIQYQDLEQINIEKIYQAQQSPEQLKGVFDIMVSSTWGLGVILLQLLTSKKVLPILKKIVLTRSSQEMKNFLLQIQAQCQINQQAYELLTNLLEINPQLRYQWPILKNHPLIKKSGNIYLNISKVHSPQPRMVEHPDLTLAQSKFPQPNNLLQKVTSPLKTNSVFFGIQDQRTTQRFQFQKNFSSNPKEIDMSHREKIKQSLAQRKNPSISGNESPKKYQNSLTSSYLYATSRVMTNIVKKDQIFTQKQSLEQLRKSKMNLSQPPVIDKQQNRMIHSNKSELQLNSKLGSKGASQLDISQNTLNESYIDDSVMKNFILEKAFPLDQNQNKIPSDQIQQKPQQNLKVYQPQQTFGTESINQHKHMVSDNPLLHVENETYSHDISSIKSSKKNETTVDKEIKHESQPSLSVFSNPFKQETLVPEYTPPPMAFVPRQQGLKNTGNFGVGNPLFLNEDLKPQIIQNKPKFQDEIPEIFPYQQQEDVSKHFKQEANSRVLTVDLEDHHQVQKQKSLEQMEAIDNQVQMLPQMNQTNTNSSIIHTPLRVSKLKSPLKGDLDVQDRSQQPHKPPDHTQQNNKTLEDLLIEELDGLEQPRETQKQNTQQQAYVQNQQLDKTQANPKQPYPSVIFKSYILRYNRYLKQVNIIGEMVAKSIDMLEANKNIWIIPLFLIFKRMCQIRIQVYEKLNAQLNPWNLANYDNFKVSQDFIQFKEQFNQENQLVIKELCDILGVAKRKIKKLDKQAQTKMELLVNTNMETDLRDQVFIYLYQQIYGRVKANIKNIKNGKQDKYTERHWLLLQAQIESSLIILELQLFDDSGQTFNLDSYVQIMRETDIDNINIFIANHEQIIDKLKVRIAESGYQI